MKNNKKQFNAHTENEPRISVRPGNFIVPGGAQSPPPREHRRASRVPSSRKSKKAAQHETKRAMQARVTSITSISAAATQDTSAIRRPRDSRPQGDNPLPPKSPPQERCKKTISAIAAIVVTATAEMPAR